ncbi:unnamed protein product [Anisakis simplex]|nr:unnamed protein product [Anisakis simplex]
MGPDVNWNNYGNVGQLFISALNKTWVAVQPTLLNPPTSDYKVTFTGYSLGGAIAALSAMLTFEEKLRSPEKVGAL